MVKLEPVLCTTLEHCAEMYKAEITVKSDKHKELLQVNDPIPFSLQYYDRTGNVREVTSVTQPNKPVYYRKLTSHNVIYSCKYLSTEVASGIPRHSSLLADST